MENKTRSKKSLLTKVTMVVLTLTVIGLFAWKLPRGYSSDLSQIGKGKNIVVQVHDHYLVNSSRLMENLDQLRAEYAGAIEFMVADLHVAEGKAFAKAHSVEAVTLLFFAPDGTHLRTVHGVQEPGVLRNTLNKVFNLH